MHFDSGRYAFGHLVYIREHCDGSLSCDGSNSGIAPADGSAINPAGG